MIRHRAAVLGSPIAHSLSPVLHRAAYAVLGLDWGYDAVECDAAALPATLDRLAPTYAGASLTMPLKLAVLPLLDVLDPVAEQVGAVNTVLFTDRGRIGHNTDVAGVRAALDELGVPVAGRQVTVLGAGGAARAVLAGLAQLGAGTVTVAARRPDAAVPLVALGGRLGLTVAPAGWPATAADLAGSHVVVSTVPAPAGGPLAATGWPGRTGLFDVGYAPWPTPLARAATAAGAPVVGGLVMLVAQAAAAVTLMTGRSAPLAAMRRAGEDALAGRG